MLKTLKVPEYKRIDALQRSVKSTVNTVYGITASPYFDVSSPCTANNITDMARCACWMMSVATAGVRSITDGTESELNKVRFWNTKKPSLNTMANLGKPDFLPRQTLDRIIEAPLGSGGDPNCKWSLVFEQGPKAFGSGHMRSAQGGLAEHQAHLRSAKTGFLAFKGEKYPLDKAPGYAYLKNISLKSGLKINLNLNGQNNSE